jgi:gamma-glutamyltranspeptidase/glutathione hydrolase
MVVSVSKPGSEAGLEILKQGGSAVDAAVATAFALAVTHPAAGNIGGGGFMMVHPAPAAGANPVCIEYRETAPRAVTRTMFTPDDSSYGHKIVGVPGTVRGMELAHRQFGKLPWKKLLAPAVRLAEEGFPLEAPLAADLNRLLVDDNSKPFAELLRVFAPPAGKPKWAAGDRLVQPELARTLKQIAEQGADAFYRGEIAQQIAAEMRAGGGLIDQQDLAAYHANVRRPIHGTYRGYDVYGPPPPSSGGICLVQMLGVLEPFQLKQKGRWSPDAVHLMVEAMRRAYCDRARYLGDADFVSIPDHLTSQAYMAKLAAAIDPAHATPSEALTPDLPLAAEGESTTHFSVIDADGMAVANTYTLEHSYGSRVVVRGAGFLLNNEMGDFNWRPGHTDRKGTIGTTANQIEPGKRMLSSQTPTLVARDGRVYLVTGSPGGRTIINTVLQVVLNVLEFEMDPRAAVDAPRLHHQWFPDRVRFEGVKRDEFASLVQGLTERGHRWDTTGARQGDAHTILVDRASGVLQGVPDRRISGHAAGW